MKTRFAILFCAAAMLIVTLAGCSAPQASSAPDAPSAPSAPAVSPAPSAPSAPVVSSAPATSAVPATLSSDPSVPDKLDEELATRVYQIVYGFSDDLLTPEGKREGGWEYHPASDTEGMVTGNRGGGTTMVLTGSWVTVIDTGSIGQISMVAIVDLTSDSMIYQMYSEG